MDTHDVLPELSVALRRFLVATHNLNVPWFTMPTVNDGITHCGTVDQVLTRVDHLVLLRIHSPSSLPQSELVGKSHTESCEVA